MHNISIAANCAGKLLAAGTLLWIALVAQAFAQQSSADQPAPTHGNANAQNVDGQNEVGQDNGQSEVTPGASPQDVTWAVNYKMPGHTCKKPSTRATNQESTRVEKFRRQGKRYVKCVKQYQQTLFADFKRIQEIGQAGVTNQQATVMLEHMRTLSTTIKSFSGNVVCNGSEAEMERLGNLGARAGI